MNRPPQAAEPSMEEILASIRRIISDEPVNGVKSPVIELSGVTSGVLPPNPLLNGHSRSAPQNSPQGSSAPVTSFSRLGEALKAGPASEPMRQKPLKQVIDDDLAELLDELPGPMANSISQRIGSGPDSAGGLAKAESTWRALDDKPGLSPESQRPSDAGKLTVATQQSSDAAKSGVIGSVSAMLPPKRGFYPPQSNPVAKTTASAPEAVATEGRAFPGPVSAQVINSPASAPSIPLPPRPVSFDVPAGAPHISVAPVTAAEPAAHAAAPAGTRSNTDPSTAAASALGALAAGLAASGLAMNGSANPVTPTQGYADASRMTAPAATPIRSLEDAVADMMRPLLQQWLADNMPRIIEKALRVEMARSMQSAVKPPAN